MKNLEPYAEIKIISEEQKIYKWINIVSNTAYIARESTTHHKINGNEFLKILDHHRQSVIDYYNAGLSKNDMSGLCYIKITVENKLYEFNFDYKNKEMLNFANVLYRDFKHLIEFYCLNYDDVEWNIIKDIKSLAINTKFVIDDYFKKYGIIGKSDKDWLYNHFKNHIKDYAKIRKKPFKSLYLCNAIRILEKNKKTIEENVSWNSFKF